MFIVRNTCIQQDVDEIRNRNGDIISLSCGPERTTLHVMVDDCWEWDYNPMDIFPIRYGNKNIEFYITERYNDLLTMIRL